LPQVTPVVDFQPVVLTSETLIQTDVRPLLKRLIVSPWLWFALFVVYVFFTLNFSDRLPWWMVVQVGF
jgi:hypothetical protein